MLSVAGKPLVQHAADSLLGGAQLDELVVVVGPAGRPAIRTVKELAPRRVSVIGVVDRAQSGEIGSLAAASAHLASWFLISDANILYREEARTHLQLNVIDGFAQLPLLPGEPATTIYAGVGVVPKAILAGASPERNICDLLGDRVREGTPIATADYNGFYGHVATPFCLSRVRRRWSAAKLTTTPQARRSTA